ncbi:hypothetical protein TRFO_12843 [Tritrichomonas foetus]|uniref:Uncharacterized protein n=1 Tax=Tritrichomonas foetus TaxID=1144522 RepID=A0A1J4L1L0_9EUKA|nr:hypothetical protein TRFO_12843 [Tritrichomonas foetus]|eukprot:OHT16952.1 hypothetical protein TRFO_12843 [Tritrichomonas foetus]
MKQLQLTVLSMSLRCKHLTHADQIKISITSFPDHQKQKLTVKPSKLSNLNHTFTINCACSNIDKVLLLIRRKNPVKPKKIVAAHTFFLHRIPPNTTINETLDFKSPKRDQTKKMLKIPGQLQYEIRLDDPSAPPPNQQADSTANDIANNDGSIENNIDDEFLAYQTPPTSYTTDDIQYKPVKGKKLKPQKFRKKAHQI